MKSLVARSSVYAGLFVPFVKALRDSDQKSALENAHRHAAFRGMVARSRVGREDLPDACRPAREKQAADDLYQLLCGYDAPADRRHQDAFRSGLGTQLVDWMENDSLDYRVLAVQDMGEITGMRLMRTPPAQRPSVPRGVRLWRQRLKSGEVHTVSP